MEPFDRYRSRAASEGAKHGVPDEPAKNRDEAPAGHYFTDEQLLALAWKIVGATMAALGVEPDEVRSSGDLVAPTLLGLLREYGVTVSEGDTK